MAFRQMISERRRKMAVSWNLPGLVMPSTHLVLDYFKKGSPNFINYKGQSLNGPQQVEALAQAQSIGTYDQCGWAIPMTTVVYSILVYLLDPVLQRKWQLFGISLTSTQPPCVGLCCQGKSSFSVWEKHSWQQVQLHRDRRGWCFCHVRHLHAAIPFGFRRFPQVAPALLAHRNCLWLSYSRLG
jgi:hypothetical protein